MPHKSSWIRKLPRLAGRCGCDRILSRARRNSAGSGQYIVPKLEQHPEIRRDLYGGSPIIIDWDGTGIRLTGQDGAKIWTFFPNRTAVKIGWIASDSTNVFLVLDRNGNGIIDDASEMFGNLTEQPVSSQSNGFAALEIFDLPENGGNGDGIIDIQDRVYQELRLMRGDMSLHTLPEYGIRSISLKYRLAHRVDQYRNEGEFKSVVETDDSSRRETVAYDWWLSYTPFIKLSIACIPRKLAALLKLSASV